MKLEKFRIVAICMILLILQYRLSAQYVNYQVNYTYIDNSNLDLSNYHDLIYGLDVNATINLKSDSSLVRIILVDNAGVKYLVFEAFSLKDSIGNVTAANECDETCMLNGVSPTFIMLQVIDATINLNSINMNTSRMVYSKDSMDKRIDIIRKEKIAKINTNINNRRMLWHAAETDFSKYSFNEKASFFGGELPNLQGFEYYAAGFFEFCDSYSAEPKVVSNIVSSFDWRNRHSANVPGSLYWDGDNIDYSGWNTTRYQTQWCNDCWLFSPIYTVEALVNLYYNNSHIDINLSEQNLLSCITNTLGHCAGYYPSIAMDYIKNTGVVTEDCFAYTGDDATLCSNGCLDPTNTIKISSKSYINTISGSEDFIKENIITHGPLSSGLGVWGHAMSLVGYGVINEGDIILDGNNPHTGIQLTVPSGSSQIGKTYWIFKQSWGSWLNGTPYIYVIADKSRLNGLTYAFEMPIISTLFSDADINCVDKDGDGYYFWGIGPKPATCPTCPMEEDCDDSNPFLGPYEGDYSCSVICENLTYNSTPIGISSDAVWNADALINQDIIISNNATLKIINAKIEFQQNSKIIISKGCKLILDNAHLTSGCSTTLWQGIQIFGDATQGQSSNGVQGSVELKEGCVIENAICGISVGQLDENGNFISGSGGGIVNATDGNFINCVKAIEYALYPFQQASNAGKFKRCVFKTDDALYNTGKKPDAFITLNGVSGIYFKGCTFINNDVAHLESPRGIGIKSKDARYFVTGLCNSQTFPCASWDNSRFENLEYGIQVQNINSAYAVSIRNSEFVNNFRGASLFNVNNAEFNDNIIEVGTDKPSINQVDRKFAAFGLYMEGCRGYLVQSNRFSTSQYGRYGIIVANSGKNDEVINNNSFSNLKYAIQAEGRNGYLPLIYEADWAGRNGLFFKCNDFTNNYGFDIGVTNFTNQSGIITQGLIKRNQGNCSSSLTPALNLFYSDPYLQNLYSAVGTRPYNYYGFTSDNATNPTINSPLVTLFQCDVPYSSAACTLPNPDIIDILGTMGTISMLSAEINSLSSLFDGGNTQNLLNTVSLTNISSQVLRDALVAASPYLTDTVLIAAIQRAQQMAPAHTKDVMIANSSLTTKVMGELTKVQLPPGIRKQIVNAQTGTSPRAVVEQQISDKQYELSTATDELMRTLLNDTTTTGFNEVSSFFATIPNTESKKIAAQAYLASGSCSGLQSMLSQIPPTNPDDANFVKYFSVLADLCATGKSIDSMSIAQVQQIQDIAASGRELSVSARIILAALADSSIEETIEDIVLPDSLSIRGYLYENTDCGSNPVANDTLVIRDYYGNVMKEISPVVTSQEGWFNFDPKEVSLLKDDKYSITTKGSFTIDSLLYFPVKEWIQNSPLQMNLSKVTEVWESSYNSPDSVFATGQTVVIQGSIYSVGTTYNQNKDKDILIMKNDPSGNVIWNTLYNSGTDADDEAAGMVIDGLQNLYVLGSVGRLGDKDISLIKYDSNGVFQWATRYNYLGQEDRGVKISRDHSGNILLLGTVRASAEDMRVAVFKYSPSGQLIWSDRIPNYEKLALLPVGIYAEDNGSVTVVISDTAVRARTTIVKYDANGKWLNTSIINDFNACAYIQDNAGNNFIAGNNSTTLEVNVKKLETGLKEVWSAPIYGTLMNHPSSDYLVLDSLGNLTLLNYSKMGFSLIKLDPQGNKIWYKENLGGWYHFLYNLDMTMDKFGNAYVAATAEYKESVLTNYVYLYKFDPKGNMLWSQEARRNTASDITVSENLNVYVNGTNLYYPNNSSTPNYGLVTHKYSQCYSAINLRSMISNNTVDSTGSSYFILYPNPNNGSMQIEYVFPDGEKGVLEVYDLNGRIVYSQQLVGTSGKLPVIVKGLNSGLYYYRAYTPNRILANDRMMIIK